MINNRKEKPEDNGDDSYSSAKIMEIRISETVWRG
jgi:hypothetical protein